MLFTKLLICSFVTDDSFGPVRRALCERAGLTSVCCDCNLSTDSLYHRVCLSTLSRRYQWIGSQQVSRVDEMSIVPAASAAGMSTPPSTPYGFHTPPVVRKQAVIRRVRSVRKFLEGGWPWVSQQRLQKAISKVGELEKRGPLIGVRFGASRHLS